MRSAAPWFGAKAGWRRLPSLVALLLVLVLFGVLLRSLQEMEARAERLAVELTVRNMRTGLQLAKGEAMTQGHAFPAAWVGSNPVDWLGSPPAGYLGECSSGEAGQLAAGCWCFNRESRELLYHPRNGEQLQLSPTALFAGKKMLRWRVVANKDAGPYGGENLRVEIVTPYAWLKD